MQAGVIYSVADATAALGRAPSGGGSRTINVIDSGTLLGDRRNQLDLRFSKIFRFAGATLDANFDIYNITNTDAVLGQSCYYDDVAAADDGPSAEDFQVRRALRFLGKAQAVTNRRRFSA